jgi:hypothetical protein
VKCSDAGIDLEAPKGSHPCYGEPNSDRRENLYYYSFGGSTSVPVDASVISPTGRETVAVQALLCLLDIDYDAVTPVQGCSTNLTDDTVEDFVDGSYYMITLLARGRSDCIGTDCKSEALVREQASNFGGVAGGQAPSVPLTTKSTFPPSGTAEVVPNPNSGGVGVPVSVWMNANDCPTGTAVDPSSGSWATCEMHEWYDVDKLPDDYACPTTTCGCDKEESLSYTHGSDDILGIDLVSDPDFPCDLFKFYFGVPKTSYESVKGYAKVLSDCSTLGPDSSGIYWISGGSCHINSNTTVGSPKAPVLLISAATETRLNGGAVIYGILYVSDAETSAATLETKGNCTIYGQVIVDGALGGFNGTFQVVYNENTVARASGQGGLGTVIGGWSDFHPSWE